MQINQGHALLIIFFMVILTIKEWSFRALINSLSLIVFSLKKTIFKSYISGQSKVRKGARLRGIISQNQGDSHAASPFEVLSLTDSPESTG